MFADLHLHSYFSDGTYSPEEMVAEARRHGLAAVALTDHDTVEGCVRAELACREAGIEFIAGTELTAESRIDRIYEKEGKRGGTMTFVELVTEYRDGSGAVVAEARSTIIETSQAPQ